MTGPAVPARPSDGALAGATIPRRQVAAAVVGNALEFYDFTTYAFFAREIGAAFFPVHSHFVSLILSLATFGAGFILRPIGSVLIGRYGDRHGRKPAMLFSFALMGSAILALAVTPPYEKIGVIAPILVLAWRLAQGFALGGEVGPTTAFLVEASPAARRGLYSAWQGASQNIAAIAGGLVGVALAAMVGAAGLQAWGWRAAFLLGALVLPFGLWLRRNLPETLHHAEVATAHQPDEATVRGIRIITLGLGLIAAATVGTYAMIYMTTYARETLHMGPGIALGAQVVNGASGALGGLAGGLLADRYGRRILLIWPRVALIVAIWPAYFLMARDRDAATLLGGVFVLATLSALSTAASFVAITESVRKEMRGAIFGGVYAIAVAVFGGTTQLVMTWLIHATGDPLSPAWYVVAFTAVGLIASLMMPETAPRFSAEA
jgi:MHS family citrate/tricarballylate:H+ symporter-like MFS transporter